jgi:DNA ligase-1
MKAFAALYAALDATTSTEAKIEALAAYLQDQAQHAPADAAWAVYLLAGGKPRQAVPSVRLRRLACRLAGIDDWLFEECYQAVGDLAETIALLLPEAAPGPAPELGLADWMERRLLGLRGAGEAEQDARLASWFDELRQPVERFLLVKLIGGGFRVGAGRMLVQRALARHAGIDARRVAERMVGYTDAKRLPTAIDFQALCAADPGASGQIGLESAGPRQDGQPYPFYLAQALDAAHDDDPGAALGPAADWQAEWKYDGMRGQLVRRAGRAWLWSRGEELVGERFPEIVAAALRHLPDGTVLDGEIVVWRPASPAAAQAPAMEGAAAPAADGAGAPPQPASSTTGDAAMPPCAPEPAPFARLQERLGRKTVGRKLLAERPAGFIAYDLLEREGRDQRALPLAERRARLEALLAASAGWQPPVLVLAPVLVTAASWDERAVLRRSARDRGVEGLMLKHRASVYGVGRSRQPDAGGGWWKWKLAPLAVDGVLVYAQTGHGRRASVYTDYTFAVWSRAPRDADEAAAAVERLSAGAPVPAGALELVTFTKAYSGLSDEEFRQVDRLIRRSTVDTFGPVRSVRPSLVVEIGFEGIARSARHKKSGVALRFPRMLRLRPDKPLHEAGTLAELEALLPPGEG